MILKNLVIQDNDFNKSIKLSIQINNKQLIYSDNNSKGKTTLIRFIIYSLGFRIPSTKKVDMCRYTTTMQLVSDDNQEISVVRNNDELIISYQDGTNFFYKINREIERIKAQSMIFFSDKINLIEGILPVFYIDQDKGWRLVNRGTVIGDNSFYIEDFILALNDKVEERIATKIKELSIEKDRYQAIRCLMSYELESNQKRNVYQQSDILEELLASRGIKKLEISECENEISSLRAISEDNNSLIDYIEKNNILVAYAGEEFLLRKENVVGYELNQNILNARIHSLEIEKAMKCRELAEIEQKIEATNVLITPEKIEEKIAYEIHNLPISGIEIDHYIEQIKNQLKKQRKLRKEIVRDGNSGISDYIAKNVKDITTKMGVFDYISSEKDYIFTKNIKALSGAILHKISISYKVAYLKALEEFLGIRLPFIIDSPCSGEVTLENAKEMLKIVMQELPEHQIIVASIHKFDEINFDRIKLVEGIFGRYERE